MHKKVQSYDAGDLYLEIQIYHDQISERLTLMGNLSHQFPGLFRSENQALSYFVCGAFCISKITRLDIAIKKYQAQGSGHGKNCKVLINGIYAVVGHAF